MQPQGGGGGLVFATGVSHANFLRARPNDSPMNGTPGTVAGFQADVLLSLVRRIPPSNRRAMLRAPKADDVRVSFDAEDGPSRPTCMEVPK